MKANLQQPDNAMQNKTKHTFVWAGILFCTFSVVVSTFGAALVNGIFGSGRDVVSSGLSMSSSAPGKRRGAKYMNHDADSILSDNIV